jgi:peptidoglycan/LPS O-acetylase OafA/YrhL
LRGIAVLAVLAYHLRAALLPGGFVGVDIFFVISGFVVSLSVPKRQAGSVPGLLRFFYGRRAVRILPAVLVCTLVTTLLCVMFIPYSWLSGQIEGSGLAALLGYSNFVLAAGQDSYFAPKAEFNPFTQTWSLGVEEQFYLVFPLLFLPFLRGYGRVSAALYALAAAASFTVAVAWSHGEESRAFYLVFARFWELALGVLAFQASGAWPGLAAWRPRAAHAMSWCGAGLIAYGLIATRPDRTPYPGSVVPCLATAVLLVAIRQDAQARLIGHVLTARVMRYFGTRSYSLYLWHWPVFVLMRWTCGLDTAWAVIAAPALALGAAELSYRFVERPPRRALAAGRITPGLACMIGAASIAAAYPLERNLWPLRSVIALSTVSRHREDWYPDLPRDAGAGACRVRATHDGSLGMDVMQLTPSGCAAGRPAAHRLFVIGDSHASAYQLMFALFAEDTGSQVRAYERGGCAMLAVRKADPAACAAFLDAALHDVAAQARPGDVVFLPGLRLHRISDQFAFFGEADARARMAADADWRDQDLASTVPHLATLLAAGVRIVLEAPTPVLPAPTFRCADWYSRGNPICAASGGIARTTIDALRAPVLHEFAQLKRALPAVEVWDPLLVLCPGKVCAAYLDGKPLYFDGDHIGGFANRLLVPGFEMFLR